MLHLVNSQVCIVIMYRVEAVDAVQLRAGTEAVMTASACGPAVLLD